MLVSRYTQLRNTCSRSSYRRTRVPSLFSTKGETLRLTVEKLCLRSRGTFYWPFRWEISGSLVTNVASMYRRSRVSSELLHRATFFVPFVLYFVGITMPGVFHGVTRNDYMTLSDNDWYSLKIPEKSPVPDAAIFVRFTVSYDTQWFISFHVAITTCSFLVLQMFSSP